MDSSDVPEVKSVKSPSELRSCKRTAALPPPEISIPVIPINGN